MSDLGGRVFPLLFLGYYELVHFGWECCYGEIFQWITPFQAIASLGVNTYPILDLRPFGLIFYNGVAGFFFFKGFIPSRP